MKPLLAALLMTLSSGAALALPLPPAVELDRLMLHAKAALEAKSYPEAVGQLAQAQKLGIALPESFALDYATALQGLGRTAEARNALDRYFNSYGTKGPSYKAVLALLVGMEVQEQAKSSTPAQPTSAVALAENWGLTDQDLSTMTGPAIMKKVDMANRRADILAAAQAGGARPQYLIGSSYAYGVGVDEDPVQEVAWLTKSAEQGLVRAAAALAMNRIRGTGTPQDDISGWTLLLKAASTGNAVAQYNAAMLTLTGLDVGGGMTRQYHFLEKSDALAMLRRSAESGLSVSQYALGHSYLVGSDLNGKDLKQARYWLAKAAAQNLAEAANDLASMRN